MCTIVLLRGVVPAGYGEHYPLAIVANRDEYLGRPSESVAERDGGILAPRDVQRGGTWIGVNKHGVFAGLTNRNGVIGKPGRISRGDLPNLALGEKTAYDAYAKIRDAFGSGDNPWEPTTTGSSLNGFYLIVADEQEAWLFGGDGLHLTHRPITEQVLAVTNRGVGTVGKMGIPETPRRVKHIINQWQRLDQLFQNNSWHQDRHEEEVVTNLKTLLAIHDEDRHGTCVNEPENNYGTKSSSIMLLKPQLKKFHSEMERKSETPPKVKWLYAHRERDGDGHVCEQPFVYHEWANYEPRRVKGGLA